MRGGLPAEIGEPVWHGRRSFPVVAAFGVPVVFLAVLTIAVHPLPGRAVLAAAAVAFVALLVGARGRVSVSRAIATCPPPRLLGRHVALAHV